MVSPNSLIAFASIAAFAYNAMSLYSGFVIASDASVFASSNILAAKMQAPSITYLPISIEIAFRSIPFSNSFWLASRAACLTF